MAYLTTRQNGRGRRRTVAASVHAALALDDRAEREEVVAELSAQDGARNEYRILLTQQEVDELIINLAAASSDKVRLEIAAASLHPLDDSQLLALICEVLHGREKSSSVLKR